MRARDGLLGTALLVLVAAGPLAADEVHLTSGGVVRGIVVEEGSQRVVVETPPGRVSIAASRVARVVREHSSLAELRRRSERLAPEDADGWLALGEWARARQLETGARGAFERVLALDADNAVAQQALGRVRVDGRWLTPDEARRASGLVPFEGEWLTPSEVELRLAQRAQEADLTRARIESEARVREAEARARAAEAEARRAEAEAASGAWGYGGAWWGAGWIGPSWPGYGPGGGHPTHPIAPEPRPPRPEPPPPAPERRPASWR
jgi:hypothetical protein